MGTWGHDVFENDDALDWASELGSEGVDFVAVTLMSVLESGAEFLDAGVACEGLAAAEIVARLLGRPGQMDGYTEEIDAWLSANPTTPSPQMIDDAIATVDRVLASPSELADLWSEVTGNEWRECVQGLRARLTGERSGGDLGQ